MMRIVAFAALVGAVKAGLTENGLACGTGADTDPATADSALCSYADIADTIADEVTAATTAVWTPSAAVWTPATPAVWTPSAAVWTPPTTQAVWSPATQAVWTESDSSCDDSGNTSPANQAACEALTSADASCNDSGSTSPADQAACEALTSDSGTCDDSGSTSPADQAACEALTSGVCTAAACPCWGSFEFGTAPYSTMTADNSATEITVAAALTPLTPAAALAITGPCGLTDQGPVVITTADYDMSKGFSVADGNWCGEWTARQTDAGKTCAESIFDAKGLLFLIIIGGALSIIFFECSIMAIVAATQGGKKEGDAKP